MSPTSPSCRARLALAVPILAVSWAALPSALPAASITFQRGDADGSGSLELTDAVYVLLYLFTGGAAPPCLDAADVDDTGTHELTDAVRVLGYLFTGGPAPAAPFPGCGPDATADSLGCDASPACAPDEFEALVASFGNLDTIAGTGEEDNGNDWQDSFEGGPAVAAELSRPHNALGDDAGNIYIADKESHAIRKVTPEGAIVRVAGTNALGDGGDDSAPGTTVALDNPNGIWVRGDGTVYILDTGNGKVRRLAPDGQLTTLFSVDGLVLGRGLWVADDETLAYVASGGDLKRWTPSGGVESYLADFSGIANIAVAPNGDVIVTDQSAHRVLRVGPDRVAVPIAGNGTTTGGGDGSPALETGLNEVRGVWLLPNGGYFLCTHRGSQVWYVDSTGTIHLFLDGAENAHAGDGEPFETPGRKVSEVRSVTMDRSGNLLITESDEGYVRIVRRK